ncbi:DUF815 domain-containing protein, partial [Rhizobium leguminosarum]|uniref:DUF815 domain-containing protein n=1 Tax=Rhizobium leguminosarum TaxID=384 RepID=UPI003F964965
ENSALLTLVEVHREDIASLPNLLDLLKDTPYRVIVFCDDLSFDAAVECRLQLWCEPEPMGAGIEAGREDPGERGL